MPNISPILKNKIKSMNDMPANTAHHEKIYEDLTKHANDVKPNEPKAKLIKENPIQATASYFKDLKQDTVNFATAVKTGKMNDNSLGRLNDLGLKVGALIIASYLALVRSQTKTQAVMRFVGGGAFLASMKLWPKIFLNLPARLIHGFDIGQRYISAQGDKKDFFLDNQFLPWDAYSTEELAEIGKRNGIDINSKNGKEKIERKMQKVALQNRTLWMATAGFSTPLMTGLFCDKVEPHITNSIVNGKFKKTERILSEIGDTAKGATENAKGGFKLPTPIQKFFTFIKDDYTFKERMERIDALAKQTNESGIETVVDNFMKEKSPADEGFFRELASLMKINDVKTSKDNLKMIEGFTNNTKEITAALKNLYNQNTTIRTDKESLIAILQPAFDKAKGSSRFAKSAETIVEQLGEKPTIQELKNALDSKSIKLSDEGFEDLIKKLDVDSSEFRKLISDFYRNALLPAREKLKVCLETLNPAVGEVAESKSTQHILANLGRLKDALNLSGKDVVKLKEMPDGDFSVLQQFFEQAVSDKKFGSKEYQELISKLMDTSSLTDTKTKSPFVDKNTADSLFGKLEECVKAILPNTKDDSPTKGLMDAIYGKQGEDSSVAGVIRNFLGVQRANIDTFTSRAAICANFEARLKEGKIQFHGLDLKDSQNAEFLKIARKLVYSGDPSYWKNCADMKEIVANYQQEFQNLVDAIFNEQAFKEEPDVIKAIAKNIKICGFNGDNRGAVQNIGSDAKEYAINLNLASQIKKYTTNFMNNKEWKKIFFPMFAALVVITLLAQPFFGNIKKEYPEEKQNGGKN